MYIDVRHYEEWNIDETISIQEKKEIENTIADFVLKRIKEAEVKMSIVVKDTKPIFSVPRKLPIKDFKRVSSKHHCRSIRVKSKSH